MKNQADLHIPLSLDSHDLGNMDIVPPHLLTERGRPDFRDTFGTLAERSNQIDTAIRRIRLTGFDLHPRELASATGIRVLIAEVNAQTLANEADLLACDPRRAQRVAWILSLLELERLSLRSAPLGGWSPDFTVFHGPSASQVSSAPRYLLAGIHWFQRPFPHRGPAMACLFGEAEARIASRRFDDLWHASHDIGEAVSGLLRGALERTPRRPFKDPSTRPGVPERPTYLPKVV